MERIKSGQGKHIHKGYNYKGFEIRNHGYYPPDKCVWWEAINIKTGCADYHSKTKKLIKDIIDEEVISESF